jgi:hypothetical protein
LYHFGKNDEKASGNIARAIERDPFNPLYQEECGVLLI